MKAAAFSYVRSQSILGALESLKDTNQDCKIMAGSQSLGPMLNLRLARPSMVVDISGLNELRQVALEGETIRIGACVTHAEIEDGVFSPLAGHPWQKVAASIAYRSVRNRGTIGGSIAHADPAADWVLAACAMHAMIDIVQLNHGADSPRLQTRSVPMADFMIAAYTTVLEPHEMITAIRIPAMKPNARWGYFKFCRKIGEFAETSCAAYFDPNIRVANIVIGALDGAPKRLDSLADLIARQGWTGVNDATAHPQIMQSIQQAVPERDPIDHNMIASTVARCLDRTFEVREVA